MNKFIFFVLFLGISLGYIFDVDKVIAKNFNPFDRIKRFYIDTIVSIQNTTEKYFKQVNTIEHLQDENKHLAPYKILYEEAKNKKESLLKTLNTKEDFDSKLTYVKVLSYIDFDNFTKVWLDMPKVDNSILGVVSEGYAGGIVVNQDGKAKALLNGNEKCNYAIFIGENKAPGIIHAAKKKNLLVAKYVPIWFDIKKDDEVITSGMDNIFFEGLKVGRVLSIKKKQDIQEVTIVPYANVLTQTSFFVYKKEKKKEEPKSEQKKNDKS